MDDQDESHPALQQQPPVPQAEAPSVLQPLHRPEEKEVAEEEEEEAMDDEEEEVMGQDGVIVGDEPSPVLQQQILGQEELWYWKDDMEQSHGPITTGVMIQIRIRESFTGSTHIRRDDRASFVSLWKYFPVVAKAFETPARTEKKMLYQRSCSTRLAFSKAIGDVRWRKLLRSIVPRMAHMGWCASRAFHHFVTNCVFTSTYNITTTNNLKAVLRMCFTVNATGELLGSLRNDEVCTKWFQSWRQLNRDYALIDKSYIGNIITHASNAYADAVTNHLVYGLRDHYVDLLKLRNVAHYEEVALKVLHSFIGSSRDNLSFKLSDKDKYEAEIQHRAQTEIDARVVVELEMMGRIDSYMSAFSFLRRIEERYDEVNGKKIRLVPENKMKSSFIRIDQTSINSLKSLVNNDGPHLPTSLDGVLTRVAVDVRRNQDLGSSSLRMVC